MTKNKTVLETIQPVSNSSENSYNGVTLMKACTAKDIEFNISTYLNTWRQ